MAKKEDVETTFFTIKKFFQDNLPGVIQSINDEKDDAIKMTPPDLRSYIDLSLNSGVPSFDPFMFSWLESNAMQARGASISKEPRFEILLFKSTPGGDPNQDIMGLRYMRAMEETAQLAWLKCFKGRNLEIESLTPVDVQLINSTEFHRVYGVALTVSLS